MRNKFSPAATPYERNIRMDTFDSVKEAKHRLSEELRNVVHDTEEMLKHKVQDAGEGYKTAREKLERTVKQARRELEGVEQAVIDRTKKAAKATDHYVHDHPWQSIGVGAGIGLLIGMLIGRK
jgi:ElaB/YqjD/DUF883 family membrane-anchored ribosome-binding protein